MNSLINLGLSLPEPRMKHIISILLLFFVFPLIPLSHAAAAQKKELRAGAGKSSPAESLARNAISIEDMTETDKRILALAKAAAGECARALENAVKSGQKNEEEIFSTLYFPLLPVTSPPAFSTFYDDYTDKVITPIEDSYLAKDKAILAVVLLDINGYLPSHNSKYSRPLTGNPEIDLKNHRTKRIFNDVTGYQAAINTREFLLQIYRRDTGEITADISVTVFVLNRHWGALRILYGRGE